MDLSHEPASLSSLPAEIRVKIFRYILPQLDHYTRLELKIRVHKCREVRLPGRFSRIAKVFNSEFAPLLYSETEFETASLGTGMIFLKRIGKVNSSYVKAFEFGCFYLTHAVADEIEVKYETGLAQVTDWLATSCTGLTSLSIRHAFMPARGLLLEKNLLDLKYLIDSLARLSHVYTTMKIHMWSPGQYFDWQLVLRAEPMTAEEMVSCALSLFPHNTNLNRTKAMSCHSILTT